LPKINISGKEITKVDHVSFMLAGGGGTVEPTVNCTFSMPATEDISLVEWMLAKQSPDRYKKVVIETYDRDGVLNKEWTLHKCFITSHSETEDAMGHTSTIQVSLKGVLASGTTYDGKNILTVKAGKKEKDQGV